MNTFITNTDFRKSAANLDSQRLGAQIYEGIHILSSLLGVNDKLVNPKRDVSNHPASKLWVGYEPNLLSYILYHMREWTFRGYSSDINQQNIDIIYDVRTFWDGAELIPAWITNKLIETHRSVLIQKKPSFYVALWPNCPDNLTMRYDWREE